MNGTEYTFEVRAGNDVGDSVASNPASATPAAAAVQASRAWLGRFGRTLSEQVLRAVSERFSASRESGFRGRIGGHGLAVDGGGSGEERVAAAERAEAAAPFEAVGARLGRESDDETSRGSTHSLAGRDLLAGSGFVAGAGSPGAGHLATWTHGAGSRLDGRDAGLSLDGEVRTMMLGADFARDAWKAGVVVSVSRGSGEYRGKDGGTGEVSSTLAALHPFAGFKFSERFTVWAATGAGEGRLRLNPGGGGDLETDLSYRMGAAGAVSELRAPGREGGARIGLTTDARLTRVSFEAVDASSGGGLSPGEADTWQFRLGLEGSHGFAGDGTAAVVLGPSFDIGLRLDGGDAESGFGADLGGGLTAREPGSGLSADLAARALLAHEASGFRDWGASAALGYDPDPASPLGLRASLRHRWGGPATGGAEALLARPTMAGLEEAEAGDPPSRLDATAGYGLPLSGGRLTGTPELGLGLSRGGREWRLGWRLEPARGGWGRTRFALGADATRREGAAHPGGAPVHALTLRGSLRW